MKYVPVFPRKRRGSAKRNDKAHLTGKKYMAAYMLVAAGQVTDAEIAKILKVDVEAVEEAKSKAWFKQQVASIQRTESTLRENGMPFLRSGHMALHLLRAARLWDPAKDGVPESLRDS